MGKEIREEKKVRVYLDTCVYNRPFDDQSDIRIFLEARVVYGILKMIEEEKIVSINSDALEYEITLIPDAERKLRIKTYLDLAKEYIELSDTIIKRANEIITLGIRDMDALHLAIAEKVKVDYFLTCDDDIINKVKRAQRMLKVRVCGVLEFAQEIFYAFENSK